MYFVAVSDDGSSRGHRNGTMQNFESVNRNGM